MKFSFRTSSSVHSSCLSGLHLGLPCRSCALCHERAAPRQASDTAAAWFNPIFLSGRYLKVWPFHGKHDMDVLMRARPWAVEDD